MIVGLGKSEAFRHAAGINIFVRKGKVFQNKVSPDSVDEYTIGGHGDGFTYTAVRAGLRVLVSQQSIFGPLLENLTLGASTDTHPRIMAEWPGAILLDPDYSRSLEQPFLDPDVEVGFCRTIPIDPFEFPSGFMLKLWLRLEAATYNHIREEVEKTQRERGDLTIIASPLIVLREEELGHARILGLLNRSLYHLERARHWLRPDTPPDEKGDIDALAEDIRGVFGILEQDVDYVINGIHSRHVP